MEQHVQVSSRPTSEHAAQPRLVQPPSCQLRLRELPDRELTNGLRHMVTQIHPVNRTVPVQHPAEINAPSPRYRHPARLTEQLLPLMPAEQRRAHPSLRPPAQWLEHLAQVIVETREGMRTPASLQQLCTLPTIAAITAATQQRTRPHQRVRVKVKVRLIPQRSGVCEAAVMVKRDHRYEALALRFEYVKSLNLWQCTAYADQFQQSARTSSSSIN